MAKRKQVSVFDSRYEWNGRCLKKRGSVKRFMHYEDFEADIKSLCDEIAQLQTVVAAQKALLKKRKER